eukprot:CAMPEP_0114580184 /NCGR_PEP_ID=MMETSP0125-20121206/4522_1 /TAXON_ID=485358 ORGANISM="Aristerostoma sp., Strain ATCC 50986" /NCGR_SAMPLE_ID=MMETSP0125 /ASSEMBLY_ACC=CAM_ASM_000245 /LENGTH=190 /DNA_ID=CAMNT_0001771597 /DNA_START=269 /DNA_END=838 /DNA_ORIENTATION=+
MSLLVPGIKKHYIVADLLLLHKGLNITHFKFMVTISLAFPIFVSPFDLEVLVSGLTSLDLVACSFPLPEKAFQNGHILKPKGLEHPPASAGSNHVIVSVSDDVVVHADVVVFKYLNKDFLGGEHVLKLLSFVSNLTDVDISSCWNSLLFVGLVPFLTIIVEIDDSNGLRALLEQFGKVCHGSKEGFLSLH